MRSNSRFAPSSRVPFRPWGRRLALLFALTAACNPDGGDPNNPGNQQGRSQPTLTLVSPEIGAFAGGTSVTVYGTDFRAGATVKFAGAAATQVQVKSNSEMVVTLPAYGGPAGPVEVTVENSDSGRATSASLFSYARVVLQFAPMVTRTVGASPIAIAADDVNGDGGKELLVVNNANSSVSVLLNNLDFNQNGGPYATAALPTSIALGDLNGDGRRDLVVGCSNGSDQGVSVLRGTGNGAFMTADNFSVAGTVAGVAVRDFDGDGKPDVAASVRSTNKVAVLINNGAAPSVSFASPVTSYSVDGEPTALLLSDLNSDGRDDLVVAQYGLGQVGALLSPAAGPMLVTPVKVAAVGTKPIALAGGELNGDSRVDVAVANFDSNSISLLRGAGDGTFSAVTSVPVAEHPTAVALADIDGDSKLDLVVTNSGRNQVWILLGRGDGTFDPAQKLTTGGQPWAMTVANLNSDGKPDIAVTNLADGTVSIFYNRLP